MKPISLYDRWLLLAKELKVPIVEADDTFRIISNAYSEKHRSYHDLTHISYCLDYADILVYKFDKIQKLAIWFHDFVYNTASSTNEEDSVVHAIKYIGNWLTPDEKVLLNKLILATKHNIQDFQNAIIDMKVAYVLDVDLCILGLSNYEDYRKFYARKVALEYLNTYSALDYAKGRAAFIKKFLSNKYIFSTREVRDVLEGYARRNLSNELQELSSKIEPLTKRIQTI